MGSLKPKICESKLSRVIQPFLRNSSNSAIPKDIPTHGSRPFRPSSNASLIFSSASSSIARLLLCAKYTCDSVIMPNPIAHSVKLWLPWRALMQSARYVSCFARGTALLWEHVVFQALHRLLLDRAFPVKSGD